MANDIRNLIEQLSRRKEKISGQTFSYVKLEDVLAIIDRALPALPADLAGLVWAHLAPEDPSSLTIERSAFFDALEALAGRHMAVTDEMVEAGCIAAKKAFSDKVLSGSLQQHMVRAILEAAPPAPQAADTRPGAANGSLRGERQARPTPPASGKVEAEAVAYLWTNEYGKKVADVFMPASLTSAERLFSEATVAAMQAEIERLTRLHQASIRAVKKLRERAEAAEAAEAELAKLREGLEPFSKFAGIVFERNFNNDDLVDTITASDGGQSTLYARDFFRARALLNGEAE
jgi:hypothetical protein